jgi:hypothetical protein
MPHTPATHVAVPFAGTGHTVVHVPQWFTSVWPLISQPSASVVLPLQSKKPAVHVAPQLVPLHVADVFGGTAHGVHDAVPQFAVLVLSTQLPLQLW